MLFECDRWIDRCEGPFVRHHFVHEVTTRGDIDYTHDNIHHMMSKTLSVTKFEDCLDLIDIHCRVLPLELFWKHDFYLSLEEFVSSGLSSSPIEGFEGKVNLLWVVAMSLDRCDIEFFFHLGHA